MAEGVITRFWLAHNELGILAMSISSTASTALILRLPQPNHTRRAPLPA